MVSSCMSSPKTCCSRFQACDPGVDKVSTVYELACFLSPLMVDVILPCEYAATSSRSPGTVSSWFLVPVIMQRQVFAVLGAADSVLRRRCGASDSVHRLSHTEAVEEFHIVPTCSCLRRSHFGLWTISNARPVYRRQSTADFWKNFTVSKCVRCPTRSH